MLNCNCYIAIFGSISLSYLAQACLQLLSTKYLTNHIYLIYMYKEDLALNNLQWLIWHKTQPNQIIYI